MTVQTHIPKPIKVTDAAADKVFELIFEEENPNLKLRIFVTGGGCSGMQYGFTFDEEVNPDDTVIEHMAKAKAKVTEDEEGGEEGGSVQFLIDPMSLQYLVGAEVDYAEDVQGAQFIIRNPNAKTSCGCGSSFST